MHHPLAPPAVKAETLFDWIERFPIVSIQDPFLPSQESELQELTRAVGARVQVCGADLFAARADLIRRAGQCGHANAVLIDLGFSGTVSAAKAGLDAARAAGFHTVLAAANDPRAVHFGVGWNAGQIKLGPAETRVAQCNELLRLEHDLGDLALLAHPFLPRN